uniref:RNA-directed DNA polymerase n=1 Tax=Meloidogyne enterolobii TaxID=390850 RepID=A0A6V7VXH0_MELEN|nr:unnamed protein product [Meloidogyne enterolobii]
MIKLLDPIYKLWEKPKYCKDYEIERPIRQILRIETDENIEWLKTKAILNGTEVEFILDSGAQLSCINERTWREIGSPKLSEPNYCGKTFTGSEFKIVGKFNCIVELEEAKEILLVHVTKEKLNLFGLPWIVKLEKKLGRPIVTTIKPYQESKEILAIECIEEIRAKIEIELQKKFKNVFSEGLGYCRMSKAHLELKANAKPVFVKARPVPIGVKDAIEKELNRLEKMGAIKPIEFSDWAAPILAVKKANGKIRVCMDYSTGLNKALELNRHPLPSPTDIWTNIHGSKVFSQLDLRDAYLQIELDNCSKKLTCINTHKGLFEVQRLPFGVKSAPAIFQKLMDKLIIGIPGVYAYLDDVIICSKTLEDHKLSLLRIFERIEDWGLKIQLDKCKFFQKKLKFLGHIVSDIGIEPDPVKKEIIKKLNCPKNVKELQSVMGTINYYGKFVEEMHKLRGPLDKLLQKNIDWKWGEEQEFAFEELKKILSSELLLTHFDPELEIIVTADASNYGIGAVISHKFPDGTERAIEYASKSLNSAEKNYSQIEKEGLALIFAVEKFHKLIYGRKFKLRTDHKPLLAIFGNKKGIKAYTASRLQRWALTLSNYDFEIEFSKTHEMGMADTLSRLINNQDENEDKIIALAVKNKIDCESDNELSQTEESVKYILNVLLKEKRLDIELLKNETKKDIELKLLKNYITNHWPKEVKKEMRYWSNIRQNLQVIDDCIVFSDKIVVPKILREEILHSLHEFHPGIAKMKGIAREYLYWPNIGKDIENWVNNCTECQGAAKMPAKEELCPWPATSRNWQRLHIDLLVHWPEVFGNMTNSAKDTINSLNWLFTHFGYPETLVSDNGSPFQSIEFKNYCIEKGIKQLFSPPYHPQSNGQAERFVDYFKRMMIKNCKNKNWLQEVLLNYRASPNESLGGKTPAEEFLNRKLRLKWDALRPKNIELNRNTSLTPKKEIVRNKMKNWFDKHHGAKVHDYKIGDHVWFTNYRQNKIAWLEGEIVSKKGVLYTIFAPKLKTVITRHSNQMRKRLHMETKLYNNGEINNQKIERKYELRNRTVYVSNQLNCVKRSNARLYNEGATPKKKTKVQSDESEDKMEICSDGSINSEGSNISGR